MEATRAVSCQHCGQKMNVAADLLGREVACQRCGKSTLIASPSPAGNAPSGSEVYNIVTDTVIGVNVRWKDNVVQFAVIAACVPIGILIGALVVQEHLAGALVGGFVGLLVGLFGSGIFLMIYRFIRHIRNDHR
jgi:DNA-directed RNA polymerase subunit RPC12/RpoP